MAPILREVPLDKRKYALEKVIYKAGDHALRLSETFDEGEKLLASCERMGLEGYRVEASGLPLPLRPGRLDQGQMPILARCEQRSLGALQQAQHDEAIAQDCARSL
jgi:hypothetical protein